MLLVKIGKELKRFRKRVFCSGKAHKQLEKIQYELDNLPYELYDRIANRGFSVEIPVIRTTDETLGKVLQDKCSLSRFGDGEFVLMEGGRIDYQPRSSELAERLKEVIASDIPSLLIGLPPCFGFMEDYLPATVDFWRKCMSRKRHNIYSYLDMSRVYYDAFFGRVYMHYNKTEKLHRKCEKYYEKVKKVWAGREIVICEGEGTRFGMFNDLLEGAAGVERILCPARDAFGRYDEILGAFDDIDKDKLVLAALGPTATVLAHDLCVRGYQAIDIGALDLDYEWFRRKETRLGAPLDFKYVDSGKGRQVKQLDDPEYNRQIIKRVL
jgi:glycosyltransferase family protein